MFFKHYLLYAVLRVFSFTIPYFSYLKFKVVNGNIKTDKYVKVKNHKISLSSLRSSSLFSFILSIIHSLIIIRFFFSHERVFVGDSGVQSVGTLIFFYPYSTKNGSSPLPFPSTYSVPGFRETTGRTPLAL